MPLLDGGLAGWDFEEHVASQIKGSDGKQQKTSIQDFVEAGTVVICAGPAEMPTDSAANLVPIGLVENAVVNMNRPLQRIFEIGSRLSYIIPGKAVGGLNLARVLFDGDNILKALYWGELKTIAKDVGGWKLDFNTPVSDLGADAQSVIVKERPFSGHIAQDLTSKMFQHPVGLAFYYHDVEQAQIGATYFEGCMISTYNMGINAGMNVLTESVSMEFVRARSIAISAEMDLAWGPANISQSV